jgi:hypothetical protein
MEALLAALASGLAVALAGEALKSGLGAWFRRLDPDRVEHCPACGSDQLERRLTRRESSITFPFLVVTWALAFTATIFAGIGAVFMLIAALLPGISTGFGAVAGVFLVAVVGWLITRWLRAPTLELRGRPPVRCRRCGHAFALSGRDGAQA